jgi:hypothetical protein
VVRDEHHNIKNRNGDKDMLELTGAVGYEDGDLCVEVTDTETGITRLVPEQDLPENLYLQWCGFGTVDELEEAYM